MLNLKKLNPNNLPVHVAFILDGNGRWAKRRGMPRPMGHKAGIIACKETVKNCLDLGIKVVSYYAFSTENWNRPQEEIDTIFSLLRDFIKNDLDDVFANDVKLVVSGDYTKFPQDLVEELELNMEKTKNNTKLILNLCINYGGRPEIIRAINNIIASGVKQVDEKLVSSYLYTANLPDPDFVVRTSGENRISNFMLWQNAYAEFYFPKVLWPDFNKKELIKALIEYQGRNRRFGKIVEEKK